MNLARVEEMLRQTLADLRLSRGERQALHAALEPHGLDDHRRALVRDRAFALAADEVARLDGREVVGWLAEVLKILEPKSPARVAECHFSPGPAPRERLLALIGDARRTLDICVFTITDDELARAVLAAHRSGVRVRVVSDDEKAADRGSDTADLARAGVDVLFDAEPSHMHHKFMVADRTVLATGSYNWTRSAFLENRENLLVTDDGRLVQGFLEEFERLWKSFGDRRI